MRPIPYAKMNGIGNSILVADLRGMPTNLSGEDARSLGTNPSLRFDQLMAINDPRTQGTDAFIDIFNIDGSRAGACGNGTRCVAWFIDRPLRHGDLRLETGAETLSARRIDTEVYAVDMGPPRLGWQDIPLRDPADTRDVLLPNPPSPLFARFSAVSMGNPHAVFFVPDVDAIDLQHIGPAVERHPLFPDRVNVSVASIKSRDSIRLRVWERGAGATLACGSAACATVVAAVRAGLTDREARVHLPGGELTVAWGEADGRVVMTGGVTLEHEGVLPGFAGAPSVE